MDTIILKLKLKIYNNIYEFIDDLMKMLKYSIEYMQRMSSKNKSYIYFHLPYKTIIYKNSKILKILNFKINLIDVKNSSFCKLMETRLQKQIKRLKDDNKI